MTRVGHVRCHRRTTMIDLRVAEQLAKRQTPVPSPAPQTRCTCSAVSPTRRGWRSCGISPSVSTGTLRKATTAPGRRSDRAPWFGAEHDRAPPPAVQRHGVLVLDGTPSPRPRRPGDGAGAPVWVDAPELAQNGHSAQCGAEAAAAAAGGWRTVGAGGRSWFGFCGPLRPAPGLIWRTATGTMWRWC